MNTQKRQPAPRNGGKQMTAELKSCPFCGGKAKLDENSVWDGSYYIYCTKCFAVIDNKLPKQQAISAWNRRAKEETDT